MLFTVEINNCTFIHSDIIAHVSVNLHNLTIQLDVLQGEGSVNFGNDPFCGDFNTVM